MFNYKNNFDKMEKAELISELIDLQRHIRDRSLNIMLVDYYNNMLLVLKDKAITPALKDTVKNCQISLNNTLMELNGNCGNIIQWKSRVR